MGACGCGDMHVERAYELPDKTVEGRLMNHAVGATAPLPDNLLITVCDACLRAACWHGIDVCGRAGSASVKVLDVATLRSLKRESEEFWERDNRVIRFRHQQEVA